MFLSEDAPSQSGFGAQDLLQAKPSWLLHATSMGSDDSLPPGFEAPYSAYQPKKEISQIPLIKWQCPPEISLNPEWLIGAGGESKEVAVQNQRQLGVLEAIYPHPSLTPQTPFDSPEAQDSYLDNSHIPDVPMIPVEDDEESDIPSSSGTYEKLHKQPKTVAEVNCNLIPGLPAALTVPGVEPDIVAAASAAFTAIMRSNEEGSLIDRDLLIKILSNPTLIDKLVSEYGAPKEPESSVATVSGPSQPKFSVTPVSTTQTHIPPESSFSPVSGLSQPPYSVAPVSTPQPQYSVSSGSTSHPPIPPPLPPAQMNLSAPPTNPTTTYMYARPSIFVPTTDAQNASKPLTMTPPANVKYYKSLIQQHGVRRKDASDLKSPHHYDHGPKNGEASGQNMEATANSFKQRENKPKVSKPCFYFNSGKGCRYGENCAFQHEESFQQRPAKRFKLDREIMGGN